MNKNKPLTGTITDQSQPKCVLEFETDLDD